MLVFRERVNTAKRGLMFHCYVFVPKGSQECVFYNNVPIIIVE